MASTSCSNAFTSNPLVPDINSTTSGLCRCSTDTMPVTTVYTLSLQYVLRSRNLAARIRWLPNPPDRDGRDRSWDLVVRLGRRHHSRVPANSKEIPRLPQQFLRHRRHPHRPDSAARSACPDMAPPCHGPDRIPALSNPQTGRTRIGLPPVAVLWPPLSQSSVKWEKVRLALPPGRAHTG
jgi:hypothetical protein